MEESANHELASEIAELKKQHAVLEEKMNTKHAETETAIERMNATFERLRTDMAKRDADMAKQGKSNMQWIAGFVLGSAVLVITALGFILALTPTS